MNFISCAKWIKKGVANSDPLKVQLTQEELQKIIDSTRDQIKEDQSEDEAMEEDAGAAASSNEHDEYNFKDYEKEDAQKSLFNIGYLVASDDEEYDIKDDDCNSDEEDDKIKPTDNLICVGHIDGDASVLEIYLFNEQESNLYVHHDILLPYIPLCLEWLSYDPTESKPGNLIAIGSMSAVISVWDLDVIDCLEPAYLLGKFSVKKKHNKGYGHKDAVLDLAWNRNYKHILASGSVDQTVLLWDLDTGKPSTKFSDFEDKVQSIKWQPNEYHLMLTGSSDKTAKLFDCRMTETKNKWIFKEEIEKVAWNPWDNNKIYFGTNCGNLISYDIRQNNEPLWEVKAHDKEITGLEMDANCSDLLFTCSADESVKIWDLESDSVKLRSSKSFDMEELQCLGLNPDCPYVACIGGTKKKHNFKVVNLLKQMLHSVKIEADTTPVVFNDTSTDTLQAAVKIETDTTPVVFNDPSTARLQLTENAFKSLSIKNKKFKSKKKFGHKYKNSN